MYKVIKNVIKRNEERQLFRPYNIRRAIEKANSEVGIEEQATDDEISKIIRELEKYGDEEMHVEAIQDFVQKSLMQFGRFELAGKYIAYRQVHALARQFNKTYENILTMLDGTNKEVLSENSNKNGNTNSTQRDLMAGEVSKSIADKFILPPEILEDHMTCKIHYHDRDYAAQHMINCCLVNIKDMLDNGSVMNNTMIEPPRSFRTACNVTTQYVANIASNQYGGQSVAIKHLGKYLAISRDKIRMRMKKRFDDIGIKCTEEQLSKIVEDMLSEELRDGVQLIQYQCISLMTTNGQSPFITLFLQIDDEDPYKNEVAMIVREIIRQRYEGIKNKDGVYVTPTFPKLVYVLDKNNVEGGEFYDITKLCAKCSIKRSYPDYISAKKMREIHDGEVYSCMGCVDGSEVVSYKYNGVVHVESFERMWNKFSLLYKPKVQSEEDNRHLYMEVPNLQIWDTKLEDYTVVKCLIRNVQNKWYDIKLRNGRTIKVTDNHPFETENRGIVYASDLTTDDKILINNFSSSIKSDVVKDIDDRKAWLFGLILCDGCLHNNTISVSIGLDEEDIAEEYIDAMYDIYGFTVNKKYQMRGKKGNYIDLRINLTEDNNYSARYLYNELVELFEGVNKSDRKIPDEVYTWNESARLSFLAGMIDADGYIHYTDTSNFDTVEIGSVNKELAYGQMYLAQALGYCCSMYKNYYSSKHRKVRYRLSFDADYRIVNYLKSIKKIENFRGLDRTNSTSGFDKVVNVMEIVYYECEDFSYDVTTESEHFEVSGIYSHNCRSFLSEWKITPEYAKENGLPDSEIGAYKWEGRFNQGVVSINLPQIGIEADHDMDKFWLLLEDRLMRAHRALLFRHSFLEGTLSNSSPLHWQFGGISRLKVNEPIDKLLHNGYSTISLGYIGIYETVQAMLGVSHTTPEGTGFALKIMRRLKGACDQWKEETGIGFGLYGTPRHTWAA